MNFLQSISQWIEECYKGNPDGCPTARVYFLPVTPEFVEKVIEREKPDGIFAAWGGQTALNCAVKMYQAGLFEKYNVKVLGRLAFNEGSNESAESDAW